MDVFKFIVIVYRLCFALLIIAAVAWQLADRAFGPGFSFVNFFSFFTILSNLFLAVMFLASAWIGKRGRRVALLRGAAVVYMIITGIVYMALLAPETAHLGITEPWVDIVLHRIVPIVAVLDWVAVPPLKRIKLQQLWLWMLFPVAFVIYSLVRGHIAAWYPYPFLDPTTSGGYMGVGGYCLGIAATLIFVCLLVAASGNALRRYARTHANHYPHYQDSNTPAVAWKGVRKHWLAAILIVLIAGTVATGVWTGWRLAQNTRIETRQHVSDTDIEGIQTQNDIYQGKYFEGRAAYALTNNKTIDTDIQRLVDAHFQPCRSMGTRHHSSDPIYTCTATFKVNALTDDYIVITYTFAGTDSSERVRGLAYNRQSGKRLTSSDLFKPESPYASKLSSTARELLLKRFSVAYEADEALDVSMQQATNPDSRNFNNFIFTDDEKVALFYEPGVVAPYAEGSIQLALPADHLYDILRSEIIQAFLPKLDARKAEERRLAEEARKRAEAAEVARQHTRNQVAPNRSNIDCAAMKCIALTYDDGPGPYTAQLLDMLRSRDAVATFYVLGSRVPANAAILKRAAAERNEIANHSWSHTSFTRLSNDSIAAEVEQTNHAIFNAIGTYPTSMRPPYGNYNARIIAHIGMPIAMWSGDTLDWRYRDPGTIYQHAIADARPGAVILMHDIHPASVQAAPRIIDELQRQGYVLVTMSELFGITGDNVHHFSGRILRAR